MDEVTPIFGENVFNETVMKARLPKETYKQLMKTIEGGEKLDASVATVVANAMKDWAIEKAQLILPTGSSRLQALLRKSTTASLLLQATEKL